MPKTFNVAVLVGSQRKASLTRKVAEALIDAAPEGLDCRILEIGDLAIYNEDLESEVPASWARFRKEVAAADAVLFLTPEYNRSIPGGLKNAIDVASRPGGQNRWDGKPAGIVSVTPYKLGAFGANHALRQAVVFLNVPVMQQPEAYIGGAGELFDKNGKLTSKETGEFLGKFMAAFKTWVTALAKGASDGDFEGFLATRRKVASAYSSGDAGPLDAIVAREGDATFFPPTGGSVTGAKAVVARYDADAKAFSPGSKTGLDVLQSAGSGELAFWTGFQDFKGKIGGQDAKMKLRVTELFRRDGDGWKLIHRHADPGSEAKPKG